MPSIKNLSGANQEFPVGRNDDGSPKTEVVKPGETKEIAINPDSALVRGRVHAGVIEVGKADAAAPALHRREAAE